MSAGLVAVVILCDLGRVLALTGAHDRSVDALPDTRHEYAFLTYHKAGSELLTRIAYEMGRVLGMPSWYCNFHDPISCDPNIISVYGNDHAVEAVKTCPGMRAVHLVRRPTTILASDYVYMKHLGPDQHDWWYTPSYQKTAADLNQQSLSNGILSHCKEWFSKYGSSFLELPAAIQEEGVNALHLTFESLTSNFDNTTRSMFEHLLGSNDPRIDQLVEAAARHDLSRQSGKQIDANRHVSDKVEEYSVIEEIKRLFQVGDPCVQRLVQMGTAFGYDSSF